jgi:hypothetical protein
MRVIFNFGDEPEEVPLGKRITFGKLDFIADWFGDLCDVDITPSDAPADPPTIMQALYHSQSVASPKQSL